MTRWRPTLPGPPPISNTNFGHRLGIEDLELYARFSW
jgi:hypothetical protein